MASQSVYWKFYWPLTLTGAAMLLGSQFQNGILARYPDSSRELAVFAIAGSLSFFFTSALVFIPQQINVYARSPHGRRMCFRFTLAISAGMAVPMALASLTPWGRALLGRAYGLEGDMLISVAEYLGYLAPLVILAGMRSYLAGLLIQSRLTGWVTLVNIAQLAALSGLLLLGKSLGWRAVETVAISGAASSLLELGLSYWLCQRKYHPPVKLEHEQVTYGEMMSFFWPTAITSLMFSLSRPVIFSYVSRLPEALMMLAALRVGFDFGMLFFNPLNQFRHFYVTFGNEDPTGVRTFAIRVMLVTTLIMAVVCATPLSGLFLGELLGVQGEVLWMSREVVAVMCLIPAAMTLRNYYHGQLLNTRNTFRMGVGGIARIVCIYGAAVFFFKMGILDHITASLILVVGFVAEALAVWTKAPVPVASEVRG
ncbi:MAG: hypothetical protein SFY80_01980 [Verrucomicrobiota bacterium]|nr:hypothetical protein [Verrucomicrobiota bacterium]